MQSPEDLTPAMFQILLALADGNRHGYAIMREVDERTKGEVNLGPGTLYRSIGRLLEAGLIVEVDDDASGSRQKPYRLTAGGRDALRSEARRLGRVMRQLTDKNVLPTAGDR